MEVNFAPTIGMLVLIHMKILILNDGSAYENWGIKACIDGLKHILKSAEPTAEITTMSHAMMTNKYIYDPKIFGRRLFGATSRIAKLLLPVLHVTPRIADEFEHVADQWDRGSGGRGARHAITMMRDADVILLNAEGSTYKNNLGAIKGLFMLWYAKKRLGKPVYFLNGSVTLTRVNPLLPAMVHKTFSVCDGVFIREPYSMRNVLDWYPEFTDKIRLVPDSVFALDVMESEAATHVDTPYFVFSGSMIPIDVYGPLEQSAVVATLRKLQTVVPNIAILVKDREDDALRRVAQYVGATLIGPEYTYQQVGSVLQNASFLVSGRYHHSIFATQVGCPIIPITTSSQKMEGLAELFEGLVPVPVDATYLSKTGDDIVAHAQHIVTQGASLRDQVRERARQLQQDSLDQTRYLNLNNHHEYLDE